MENVLSMANASVTSVSLAMTAQCPNVLVTVVARMAHATSQQENVYALIAMKEFFVRKRNVKTIVQVTESANKMENVYAT
jgi:hypothetical protein